DRARSCPWPPDSATLMPANASADTASHGVTLRSSLFVTCTALQAPRSARRAIGAALRPDLFGVSGKTFHATSESSGLLFTKYQAPRTTRHRIEKRSNCASRRVIAACDGLNSRAYRS